MFSFRARAEKGIAQHIDASSVVGTSNFWLVRSEHAHASYPGLFFRPLGFSPTWGGKKGEFRDWTNHRFDSANEGELAYIVNLPEPSGAKILGLFEGNTNKENAMNMAAVASRT